MCSYEHMKDHNGEVRSVIMDYIPVNCIPDRFTKESNYIHVIVTCFEMLCQNPNDVYEDMDTFIYSSIIEMIHFGKHLPPDEYTDLLPVNSLGEAIDNFNKYIVLYRFFKNKGQVFYTNNMQLIDLRLAKYVDGNIAMLKYFTDLEDDDVLRRAYHSELSMILATYKNSELEEVFSMVKPLSKIKVGSMSKREIINRVFESGEETHTELVKSFFTLNDNYQAFKAWMLDERTYFRMYLLFHTPIKTAMHKFGNVMRELISKDDYLTAKRLGELYFKVKNSSEFFEIPGIDHDENAVATQMRKIEKYFK